MTSDEPKNRERGITQASEIVIHIEGRPELPPWAYGHRPTPMAMMLTQCEQAWVDDVRAGRQHVHLKDRV